MAQIDAAGGFMFNTGMNSGVDPEFLPESSYVQSMNTVNRGGKIQVRPGYRTIFGLPCGHLQGIEMFSPVGDKEHLIFAVDGEVYVSRAPFKNYYRLKNITFQKRAKFVNFQVCLQTIDYDNTGTLYALQAPKPVIIMQDGFTPPAFWDGSTDRHLDPAPSFGGTTVSGKDETPQGLWMGWAGNRLWVGRDHEVFASDYGNPLKFVESTYLGSGKSFYVPEPVTGMVQPVADGPLIVFGENTNTKFRADIHDRGSWLTTPDFIRTDYNVGCVAGKSIVKSYGLVWWYSKQGLTNYNQALQINNDSRFRSQDNEMIVSKSNISPIKNGICGASYENYLLMSVPSGDQLNRHTWVMDQTVFPDGQKAWNSYWTGLRPLDWASGQVGGVERIFCVSKDYDGINRLWEAFTPDRQDNGCPITWSVEFKRYNHDSKQRKRFRYAELFLEEILGDFDIAAYYAGHKGGYTQILDKRIVASDGKLNNDKVIEFNDSIRRYRTQTRTIKTREADNAQNECNQCNIESDVPNYIDNSFSLLVVASGRGAIGGFRQFVDTDTNDDRVGGECEANETGTRLLSEEGCSSTDESTISSPFTEYEDAATTTLSCNNEDALASPAFGAGIGESIISDSDATKKAECNAYLDALSFLQCDTQLGVDPIGGISIS